MKEDRIRKFLDSFHDLDSVIGGVVLTKDGLLISSNLPKTNDPELIAAMAASLAGTSSNVSRHMGFGISKHTILKTKKAQLVSTNIGNAVLTALVKPRKELGLVMKEMENVAKKIHKELR